MESPTAGQRTRIPVTCTECNHHIYVRKSEYYSVNPVTGEPTFEDYSLYIACSNCSAPVPTITTQALVNELNSASAIDPFSILDKLRAKESLEGPFMCSECHHPLYVIRSSYYTPDPVTRTLVLEDISYYVECSSQELHVPTDPLATAVVDLVKLSIHGEEY